MSDASRWTRRSTTHGPGATGCRTWIWTRALPRGSPGRIRSAPTGLLDAIHHDILVKAFRSDLGPGCELIVAFGKRLGECLGEAFVA